MLSVWMIWIQGDGDVVWLHAAWDDDSTAENHAGWMEEVGKAHKLAFENGYEVRIQRVRVPGVFEMFEMPQVTAEPA